jgi:hypothetical protein
VFGEFEDVIFYRGAFHTLSRDGFLFRTLPKIPSHQTGYAIRCVHSLVVFLGPLDVPDAHLLATYLVISRGDLMMVSRYTNSPGELTSFFRVHILVPINQPGESQQMYMWQAVEELDGRILYVARGCSMSFESVEHPEVDEGVYFLDDRSFNCWSMISNGAYSGRRYMANDNGFWSWKTKAIKRFPCGLECSEYSSPVWILHRA